MKIGILLWVYKDVPLSVNRAQWLRRLNPGTPIYCLYGGPETEADRFAAALDLLTDDFYVFKEPLTPYEKWLHGDRLIAAWHRDRGHALDWDTVFIAQWDLALLASVAELVGTLGKDEVLFSGTRPIAEVEHFWSWLKPGSDERRDYLAFREELERQGLFPAEPLCCNLVAAALPRAYLDRYVAEAPRIGFSEYKMTILAQAWGFPVCMDHRLDSRWMKEGDISWWRQRFAVLHAENDILVRRQMMGLNALWPWGHRAFHPLVEPVPLWMLKLPTIRPGRPSHAASRQPVTTTSPAAR